MSHSGRNWSSWVATAHTATWAGAKRVARRENEATWATSGSVASSDGWATWWAYGEVPSCDTSRWNRRVELRGPESGPVGGPAGDEEDERRTTRPCGSRSSRRGPRGAARTRRARRPPGARAVSSSSAHRRGQGGRQAAADGQVGRIRSSLSLGSAVLTCSWHSHARTLAESRHSCMSKSPLLLDREPLETQRRRRHALTAYSLPRPAVRPPHAPRGALFVRP